MLKCLIDRIFSLPSAAWERVHWQRVNYFIFVGAGISSPCFSFSDLPKRGLEAVASGGKVRR